MHSIYFVHLRSTSPPFLCIITKDLPPLFGHFRSDPAFLAILCFRRDISDDSAILILRSISTRVFEWPIESFREAVPVDKRQFLYDCAVEVGWHKGIK